MARCHQLLGLRSALTDEKGSGESSPNAKFTSVHTAAVCWHRLSPKPDARVSCFVVTRPLQSTTPQYRVP